MYMIRYAANWKHAHLCSPPMFNGEEAQALADREYDAILEMPFQECAAELNDKFENLLLEAQRRKYEDLDKLVLHNGEWA